MTQEFKEKDGSFVRLNKNKQRPYSSIGRVNKMPMTRPSLTVSQERVFTRPESVLNRSLKEQIRGEKNIKDWNILKIEEPTFAITKEPESKPES